MRRVLSCDEDLSHWSAGWIFLLNPNLPDRMLRKEGPLLLGPQLEVGMHPCRTEGSLHTLADCEVSASIKLHDGMLCVSNTMPLTRHPVKWLMAGLTQFECGA